MRGVAIEIGMGGGAMPLATYARWYPECSDVNECDERMSI